MTTLEGSTTTWSPQLDPRFSAPGAAPTSWPEVRQVLTDAELFWISTVRADGRPHITP
ncbi:pyridoxamine 5'-phosphate oxidase family protein [Nitriliruptor alkaliphilus]|uniref:pyridoxamine 5'-phosphate oxidase family protein n=1 Tax=Nitriliruptor alkaliphilus TaxID=427918 RepID=UPI001B80994B|nr:pyridoxamine 5'-phosphate oxidase family protein [Nitriliruptor alkaliphilus]